METLLMTEQRREYVKAGGLVPRNVHKEVQQYLFEDEISYTEWLIAQEAKFVEERRRQRELQRQEHNE